MLASLGELLMVIAYLYLPLYKGHSMYVVVHEWLHFIPSWITGASPKIYWEKQGHTKAHVKAKYVSVVQMVITVLCPVVQDVYMLSYFIKPDLISLMTIFLLKLNFIKRSWGDGAILYFKLPLNFNTILIPFLGTLGFALLNLYETVWQYPIGVLTLGYTSAWYFNTATNEKYKEQIYDHLFFDDF